jgi:phage shock protein A
MNLREKLRIGVLGQLSELLDRVVNTPAGVAQLIRDLESAMGKLAENVGEAQGNVTGIQRDIAAAQARVAQLESDADLLINDDDPSNDVHAIELQAQADDSREHLEEQQTQLSDAQALASELSSAMSALETRHREMVAKYRQLRVLDAAARAKNQAAQAIGAASNVLAGTGVDSVDNVARAIQTRSDAADARLQLALGQLHSASGGDPAEAVRLARAKQQLLKRHPQVTAAALAAERDDVPAGSAG